MRTSLRHLLPSSRFARSITTLAGGAGAAQLVTIAGAPILTRLYAPEDFGVLAVFAGLLSILAVVSSLRYELAIPLPQEDGEAANVLALTLVLAAVFSLTTLIISTGWGLALTEFAGAPVLAEFLWLLPIALLGAATYRALSMWAVRKQIYRQIAITRVSQSLYSTVTQIVLGALRFGVLGLLIGQVIFQAAGITRLTRIILRESRSSLAQVTPQSVRRVMTRYSDLPKYSVLSAVLNRAGTSLPPILIVAMFGPAIGGMYYLTQRVVGVPATVVGQAVQKAYFGEFATLIRDRPETSSSLFWMVVRLQTTMSVPVMLSVTAVAPWLFYFVFGPEWKEAGTYLQVLAPMYALRFISTPVAVTLTVLERQDLALYREFVRLLMVVAALAAAKVMDMSPLGAIVSLSIAGSAGYLLHVFVSWWALREHTRLLVHRNADGVS
jgi:O-antigen/teichoic acid export membrane protein